MADKVLLDSEQRKVVNYDGSSICIAGPGSGKTRVLTEKAKVLREAGEDVIALTFTRAAAAEIRSRVPTIAAGTVHSFAHSVFGWSGNFDALLDKYLERGRDKFDWVLVDEVQDLTAAQFDLVTSLVRKNIFAVGDPYQCIYMYADALGSTAINTLADMTGTKHTLLNNYRSDDQVVRRLNRLYPRGLISAGVNRNGLTAILCRRNVDVDSVSEYLKREGIGHSVRRGGDTSSRKIQFFGSDQIWVSTIHVAKGLEYDNVGLYGWLPDDPYERRKKDSTDEDLNVYYVAISRAAINYSEIKYLDESKYLLDKWIPELDEIKYTARSPRAPKDRSKTVQVTISPEWYQAVKPWLLRTRTEGRELMAVEAQGMLTALRTYEMRLLQLNLTTRVTISTKQLEMLNHYAEFAEVEGITE